MFLEVIHLVVFTRGFQRLCTREARLVVVPHVGACHVLMLDTGDAETDFLALNPGDVTQHTFVTEIVPGQRIGG